MQTRHSDKASLGIVDEVGASLPGGSMGPSWRSGHAQIHTGDPVPKLIWIQVTLHVDQTHRFEYR